MISMDMLLPIGILVLSFVGLIVVCIPRKTMGAKLITLVVAEVICLVVLTVGVTTMLNNAEDIGYVDGYTKDMYISDGRITKNKLSKIYKYSQPNGIIYTLHDIEVGDNLSVLKDCQKKVKLFGVDLYINYNKATLPKETMERLETIGSVATS